MNKYDEKKSGLCYDAFMKKPEIQILSFREATPFKLNEKPLKVDWEEYELSHDPFRDPFEGDDKKWDAFFKSVHDYLKKELLPLTFYVNEDKKTVVCKHEGKIAKVKCSEHDQWNEYTGLLAAYLKLHCPEALKAIEKATIVHQEKEQKETKKTDSKKHKGGKKNA